MGETKFSTTSFSQKLLVCLLSGIIGVYTIYELDRKIFAKWIMAIDCICALFFISAIVFVFIWHNKEKRQKIDSLSVLAFLQSVVCYFIATDLCMFAWRKIFHLQFYAPTALLDKPFNNLTGEQLTIGYFGYSYPFALCIAAIQIAGSFLLLFKRTRLLGVFILLPIVVNIILIDLFYNIETGALFQAIALISGLSYILFTEWDRIVEFFLSIRGNKQPSYFKNIFFKNLIRGLVVLIPFAVCIFLYDFPNRHPELTGKYEVKNLMIKHTGLSVLRDSTLTLVYFDDNNDMVFEYNSQSRRQIGHFNFNRNSRQLRTIWRYPQNLHDTLFATLSKINEANKMILSGVMGKYTIVADLVKLK